MGVGIYRKGLQEAAMRLLLLMLGIGVGIVGPKLKTIHGVRFMTMHWVARIAGL